MARLSDIVQLVVSLAVIGLFWLIYPGVMVLVASAVGLTYVAASVGDLRGNRLARRIAFVFSAATAVFASLGVVRFAANGFSYVSGNFESAGGVYWPPYAFLGIAAGAALVVVLRLASAHKGGGDSQS